MATVTATFTTNLLGFQIWQWTPLTNADTCAAVEAGGMTDRSVQISGTWDSATVVIKGSNDGTTYLAMTDPQGNSISKTADAIEQIEEGTRYIQPTHSGGGASESLTITLFVAKSVRK